MSELTIYIIETILKATIILAVLATLAAFTTYIERKVLARFHRRIGPAHVGYAGVLQIVADGIKLFLKEDIVPSKAIKQIYLYAPIITAACAFIAMAPIPFLPPFELFGREIKFIVSDVNIGILFVLAVTGAGMYGPLLAGMATRNKWAIIGAARTSLQFISYEIITSMSLLAPIMIVGSLSITAMVEHQSGSIFNWLIFKQPIAFTLFMVAGYAETNRTPMESIENETEIIAGYSTEYSGLRWGMFFVGEYANMYTFAFLVSLVFLGGWNDFYFIPGAIAIIVKVMVLIFLFLWARGTYPHIRPDQIMWFMWKVLLPLATINVLVTGVILL